MTKLNINNTLRLLFFILLSNQFCQAQYISFDELLSLRAKDLDEVNDYLIKKKWEIDNAKEGDYEEYNRATWAFNKNHYENKARAWFSYLYADGFTNVIRYMTTSSTYHDLIKARIKALGFKLSDKAIEENGLAFTYINEQRTVKVTTDKDEDGIPRYSFLVKKSSTSISKKAENPKVSYLIGGKIKINKSLIPIWKDNLPTEVEVDMLPIGASLYVIKEGGNNTIYVKYIDSDNSVHYGYVFKNDL